MKNIFKEIIWVCMGSGLGGVLRYVFSVYIHHPDYPKATLISNLIACFLLGLSYSFVQNTYLRLIVVVGICGGLSTFSTWIKELIEMFDNKAYLRMFCYVFFSMLLGAISFVLGLAISKKVTSL